MKSLKEVEQLTGIKADNLRQRIARKTLKAFKKGRDWFISEVELLKLLGNLIANSKDGGYLQFINNEEAQKYLEKLNSKPDTNNLWETKAQENVSPCCNSPLDDNRLCPVCKEHC